jgi:hypothetical protein
MDLHIKRNLISIDRLLENLFHFFIIYHLEASGFNVISIIFLEKLNLKKWS